jgi:SRSO17 transposase
MVLAVDGVAPKAVRAMQSFSSAGQGNDARLWHQPWQEGEADLGADAGGLRVDGSDVPQQGVHAVGVTRQDCGARGQRATGQAGVFVGYGSLPGDTVRDRRLSVPTAWLPDDADADRRRQGGLPPALPGQTKPAVAQERRAAVVKRQGLRGRGVGADEAFGGNPGFLAGVAGRGLGYVTEVPHPTRGWEEGPATHIPPRRGRGRRPPRERLVEGAPQARPVLAVAGARPAAAWTRQTIQEGSQGPMGADVAAIRVVAVRDALPGPEVWVGLRRHVETGEVQRYLCTAPGDTALEQLVPMSGMRWPIETCVEASKQLLGRGDEAVRRWLGWPHPMTVVILAPFFVVRMSLR